MISEARSAGGGGLLELAIPRLLRHIQKKGEITIKLQKFERIISSVLVTYAGRAREEM